MCRIRRVPATLDQFVCTWPPGFHWDHGASCRWLVLVIAMAWGRRPVANRDRAMEAPPHRTRVHTFVLVARWDPAAARRQHAPARLRALHLGTGATLSVGLDAAKKATRGKAMEAVATMHDPMPAGDIRGHQDGGARLVGRAPVIPWGLRLYVKPEPATALGRPVDQTTALAGPRIRELKAPAGVTVMVWCAADDRCHTVVQAGQEQPFPFASTLTRHRRLFTQAWKRNAGRDGKQLFRRRRTPTGGRATPQGVVGSRVGDAGWLGVSQRGQRQGVCSRPGSARKILGLVTDAPALSGAGLIRTDENRWAIEPCGKDRQPLLGRGHNQHRPDRAAVTPRPLVGFADALLTPLRLERPGAQGQQAHHTAADMSVATAQEALRCWLWDDLVASLKEQHRGEAVLAELERLRVACTEQKSVHMRWLDYFML